MVDQRHELFDRTLRPVREAAVFVGPRQRLPKRKPLSLGKTVDVTDAGVANGSLWDVDHTPVRHRVVGVDECPQIGQGVLYLAPVVVLETADDLIRDPELDEQFLQHPALGIGAVEDGDIAQRPARLLEVGHLLGNVGRLVVLILGLEGDDVLALAQVGPEAFWLASHVVGDHCVGGVEDGLG